MGGGPPNPSRTADPTVQGFNRSDASAGSAVQVTSLAG
jgi:hypothetical protein